jgi:uncharacterized membrane protein YdbT with pleckstrin-like domain
MNLVIPILILFILWTIIGAWVLWQYIGFSKAERDNP